VAREQVPTTHTGDAPGLAAVPPSSAPAPQVTLASANWASGHYSLTAVGPHSTVNMDIDLTQWVRPPEWPEPSTELPLAVDLVLGQQVFVLQPPNRPKLGVATGSHQTHCKRQPTLRCDHPDTPDLATRALGAPRGLVVGFGHCRLGRGSLAPAAHRAPAGAGAVEARPGQPPGYAGRSGGRRCPRNQPAADRHTGQRPGGQAGA
jgi:hypothetical protein